MYTAEMLRPSQRTRTLDGLRGIAVLAVVIEHAWPSLLPGGFAGVDVFFVLSGYLITRILVEELDRTGRLDLVGFYARRVRRILPAALITVLATCALYAVLLGPALPDSVVHEALAAAFSVPNLLFASRATDYFAANPSASPFLHFWSLGVEEQFYLLWPALLLVLTVAARRHRSRRLGPFVPHAAIAGIAIASLALALVSSQSYAFFLLPQRAWELMVGGFLAWFHHNGTARLPALRRPYRAVAVAFGAFGLAAVFAAAPSLGPWPGPGTVLAVSGAAILVAGGDEMPGARALAAPPLRFFGRISYAMYLWHWPLLAAAALLALPQTSPSPGVTALVVGLAIVIATVSTILVEEPIRISRAPWLSRRRAIVSGVAVAATVGIMALTVTSAVALAVTARNELNSALSIVRGDRERLGADDCYPKLGDPRVRECVYGAAANADGSPVQSVPAGMPVVVLFGDSHAEMWFPLIDEWAKETGVALFPLTKPSCAALDAPVWFDADACSAWRRSALTRLDALRPVLTIVTSSTAVHLNLGGRLVQPRVTDPREWIAPAAGMLENLRERSRHILFLGDVPRPGFSVPDCLAAHRWSPSDCALPLSEALPPAVLDAEKKAAEIAGVSFVDPSPWLCPQQTCTWMTGDRIGWADNHHLTTSGALAMRTQLKPLLDQALSIAQG